MCLPKLHCSDRNHIAEFKKANDEINKLDSIDPEKNQDEIYRLYQLRNCFGLAPDTKIYRIFQEQYYEEDVSNRQLTLPRADPKIWKSDYENPLVAVTEKDPITSGEIAWGDLVRKYHALCWTLRAEPKEDDWNSFSHGKKAIRIETKIGKLMDRVMDRCDNSYMYRSWVIDVNYQPLEKIKGMQSPEELRKRVESSGALLALSAATVEKGYHDEDEVRFLFDAGLEPKRWTKKQEDLIS